MAKQVKTTVRFELRTSKINKQGKAPIRIVYQLQQQRKFYPTRLKCFPVQWNTKEQRVIFISKKDAKKTAPEINYELLLKQSEVIDFNRDLLDYEQNIRDTEERFKLDGITFTPSSVLDALKHKKPEAKKDELGKVVGFIHQFIRDNTATIKPGTLKVYSGLGSHLEDFERHGGAKATFQNMDISFFRAFHSYLCTNRAVVRKGKKRLVKAMNNITAAKELSTLKTLLNYARIHYKIEVNQGYRDYSITRKDNHFEVITLSRDEFETLFHLDLSYNKRLGQVRDIFCFSCSTSLRYSDLMQLKWEHIRANAIRMTAAKTGQRLDIPLNEFSAAILEKYKAEAMPLPLSTHKKFISGQKLNNYIKELCRISKIDTPIEIVREYGIRKVATIHPKHELLSIHSGRKTFITLSLEREIPLQEVMAFSGHSSFKSVKRYVDVSEKQKQATMAKAWGHPKSQLKAV
jgi:integrase